MSDINIELLQKAASILKDDQYALIGSKWEHYESIMIVSQAIYSCAYNLEHNNDPFSWVGNNLMINDFRMAKNFAGFSALIDEGYIIMKTYHGSLNAPATTVRVNNKPQVLRVTNKLLEYVIKFAS